MWSSYHSAMRYVSLRVFVQRSDFRPLSTCVPIALAPSTMGILCTFHEPAFCTFLALFTLPRSFLAKNSNNRRNKKKKKGKRQETKDTCLVPSFCVFSCLAGGTLTSPVDWPMIALSPGPFPLHRPTKRNWAVGLCLFLLFLQAVLSFLAAVWCLVAARLRSFHGIPASIPCRQARPHHARPILLWPNTTPGPHSPLQALSSQASNFLCAPRAGGLASFAPAIFFSRCSTPRHP